MSETKAAAIAATGERERHRIGDRVAIFRKPKSKFWYIDYSEANHQFRHSLRTTSRKQATILAKNRAAELVLGIAPSQKRISIDKAVEQFLQAKALQGKRPKTLSEYKRILSQMQAFANSQGVVWLEKTDTGFLEKFQLLLSSEGAGVVMRRAKRGRRFSKNGLRTTQGKMKTVRQLHRWARRRRLLREDPAPGYELPKKSKLKGFCWDENQFKRIIFAADQTWRDRFDFFAMTGLRSEEFCWLTKDDLGQSGRNCYVRIREKVCPQSGKHWQPKHGQERIIPLCARAAEIARRAITSSPGPWLFWSDNTRGSQPGHLTSQVVWRALKRTMTAASVTRGTVHTFRHFFCSFAANNRIPPFQVMKILGHGSLDIVLLYYHVTDDELFNAVNGLPFDELLAKSEGGKN